MVDGDPAAPLLIVAMAPGRDELTQGAPLVGPSGKLLWACAARSGFSRADCYIVNTIGEIQKGKGGPSAEEFNTYWDQFDDYISRFEGRVVLCLGGDALWRFTGVSDEITKWRGYLVTPPDFRALSRTREEQKPYTRNTSKHKKGDLRIVKTGSQVRPVVPPYLETVVPTLHPSGVMRTGFKSMPALAYDVDRAWRAATDRLSVFMPDIRETSIQFGHAPFVMPGPVAIDIETGRSLSNSAFITLVGIAAGRAAWSFSWTPISREAVNDAISRSTLVVGHNLSFDIPRLINNGVKIPKDRIYDTMLACQILQPDMLKGLNWVASMYLDTVRWKHLSDSRPEYYNAMDAAASLELYRVTERALRETGQTELFGAVMKALPVLMNMTSRGIAMDPIRKEEWRSSLISTEKALLAEWLKIHNGVSPNSPAQLKKLYYDTLGYPVQTEEGKPTVNQSALQSLLMTTNDPSIRILLEYRRTNKMRSSFADVNLPPDGCVHPSYLPSSKDFDSETGKGMAGTGRIQAREPNIMQQPTEARRMYVPHSRDNRFVEFDYDQAELRVVAALSGDRNLLQRLDHTDIHQVHADRWGCSRKDAKILLYATMYGARERKLQIVYQQKGIRRTQAECRALQQRFFDEYPDVRVWQESITAQVASEGCLRNPFGRLRYFPDRRDIPAALDFLPQSTVADIVWHTLPTLDHAVTTLGGALITCVHDSYLLELPEAVIFDSEAVGSLSLILTREWPQVAPGFRLPVSLKIGPTWGDVSSPPPLDIGGDMDDLADVS